MRKKKKLTLSKETVRNLVDQEAWQVVGARTVSNCAKICDSEWDCTYTCNINCL
jgi:hypothetical protein